LKVALKEATFLFISLTGCKDDKILRHYDFKNLGMKNEGMKEGMKE
jgi:hypothetical protein